MRNITNDYHDAQVLDLGTSGARGPYLVIQTGVSPRAEIPKTHLFVLRPDGQWVDFNAYACQLKPEAMDEIVFQSMTDVMTLFGRLIGPPRVLDMPIDEAGLKEWLAQHEGKDSLASARAWAAKYRERHPK